VGNETCALFFNLHEYIYDVVAGVVSYVVRKQYLLHEKYFLCCLV